MIRVESISIKEFRGIRDLTLDFDGKNFAICGPNGTGKSGVVDALEFALTGSVSRLSGEGRGDVSLKQHGPHVDKRADPDKARVMVQVSIPSLDKTATLERSLKNPKTARVLPDDSTVLGILAQVEAHPEIVLSRRELIRYVLATPGKRAEEVQALLHLNQVEQVRSNLQKIANSHERQLTPLSANVTLARENLIRALGISELTKESTIAAVNAQRAILALPPIIEVTASTSFKDGMTAPIPAKPQRIPKTQALADIRAAHEVIEDITSPATATVVAETTAALTHLLEDPEVASSVRREGFYATGLDLIDVEACPLCDNPWNQDELKRHIQQKVDHLKEITRIRNAAESKISPLIAAVRKIYASTITLIGYAALGKPPLKIEAAREYASSCKAVIEQLSAFSPIAGTINALAKVPSVRESFIEEIKALEDVVASLPEPTKQDAARDWLTVAQERMEVFREAGRHYTIVKEQAQRTRLVSDTYAATSDKVLTGIYSAVETEFARLYAYVNRDDEGKFKAQLTPSMGKLGFDVDFYGRGFFPPGAYHSEGHQDSMGLCLYLALMRYILGTAFTLAILDDVLMSVDVGHRRVVCELLKTDFPDTQFIMTTHDPIWLRHMKTVRLIDGRSAVKFSSWSVDHGPTRWDSKDVWAVIEDHRKQNDVRSAAAFLRHYLEFESAELCHKLRARVEFRDDHQYQLGELLPAAIDRMREVYRIAKSAANSWNRREVVAQLADYESTFSAFAGASKAEEWQVNVAVHYNSWDNLGSEDFAPVLKAFRNLIAAFTCPDCGEILRVIPERETHDVVCCGCNKINFTLRKKGD